MNFLLAFRSSIVAQDQRLSSKPYFVCIFLSIACSIGCTALFSLGVFVFKEGLIGYPSSPFYPYYAILNIILTVIYGTNNILSTFYFLLNIYKIKGLRMNAFLMDWLHSQDGFRLLFNISANILTIIAAMIILITKSQDGIQNQLFCKCIMMFTESTN